MVNLIRISSEYAVKDQEKVIINAKIGDGQLGWIVLAKDNIILENEKNELEYDLGMGKDLKGKTLIVRSTVFDVNRNTNKTSVTYQLRGGVIEYKTSTLGNVDNDNDPILHDGEFKFV